MFDGDESGLLSKNTVLLQVLANDIETINNGSLKKFLKLLLLSSIECDCFELRRTLQRSKLDENALIEVLFARSQDHIRAVQSTYQTCKLSRESSTSEKCLFSV